MFATRVAACGADGATRVMRATMWSPSLASGAAVARARVLSRRSAVARGDVNLCRQRRHLYRQRAARDVRASAERVDESDDADITTALARTLASKAKALYVKSDMVIGVSRGDHVAELMRAVSEDIRSGALTNIKVVACEALAAKEAAVCGLEIRSEDEVRMIDVSFVQPSECALVVVNGEKSFGAVLGRETTPVQPDLERQKRVMASSSKVVLLKELFVDKVGGSIPCTVPADDWEEYAEELDDLLLGDAEVWRRGATFDANPRGGKNPYISSDGSHTLLDLRFEDPINAGRWECGLMLDGKPCGPYELQQALENDVEGVIAHGLYMQADSVITVNPETMEAVEIKRD